MATLAKIEEKWREMKRNEETEKEPEAETEATNNNLRPLNPYAHPCKHYPIGKVVKNK